MDDSLHDFIEQHTGENYLRVQDDLGCGFVRLRAAEAQRRQAKQDIRSFEDVVIELLRNARDAGARSIFVATWNEGKTRRLTMLDDGSGIPRELHETVFEPFVTSKLDTFHSDRWGVHGRGMALYSIKQNCQNAHIVASAPHLGSVFSVTSEPAQLPEKRDQSTLPSVTRNDEGSLVLKGPHNIARVAMEFAIDERGRVAVYVGSPAEIASTLHALADSADSRLSSIFAQRDDTTPYLQRFAFATEVDELTALANELALPISARTARRILKGEIAPLPTHLERLVEQKEHAEPATTLVKSTLARRAPAISAEDLEAFGHDCLASFTKIAEAYYLEFDVAPSVKVNRGDLVVRIPLVERS